MPGYLHLDLPQYVMQNVSGFRLRAHTLNVETAYWEDGTSPKLFYFMSELSDLLLAGMDQPQAD
eukprot:1145006-Pelagomonas_calceolata.AAC.2